MIHICNHTMIIIMIVTSIGLTIHQSAKVIPELVGFEMVEPE